MAEAVEWSGRKDGLDGQDAAYTKYRQQSETRRRLPQAFVAAYVGVCDEGLADLQSALGNVSDMPSAPRSNKKGKHNGGLIDDVAVEYRKAVDRRLRQIGREMRGWLSSDRAGRISAAKEGARRCGACAKYVDRDWNNCVWCGSGLNEEGVPDDGSVASATVAATPRDRGLGEDVDRRQGQRREDRRGGGDEGSPSRGGRERVPSMDGVLRCTISDLESSMCAHCRGIEPDWLDEGE